MVGAVGFEPTISCSQSTCVSHYATPRRRKYRRCAPAKPANRRCQPTTRSPRWIRGSRIHRRQRRGQGSWLTSKTWRWTKAPSVVGSVRFGCAPSMTMYGWTRTWTSCVPRKVTS